MSDESVELQPNRLSMALDSLMTKLQPLWDRFIILEPERWIIAVVLLASGQASVHSSNNRELFWLMSIDATTMLNYLAVLFILSASAIGRQLARRMKSEEVGPANRLGGHETDGKVWLGIAYALLAAGILRSVTWGLSGIVYALALYLVTGGLEQLSARSDRPMKPFRVAEYFGTALLLLLIGWRITEGDANLMGAMLTPYLLGTTAVILLLLIEPFNHASQGAAIGPNTTYGWALLFIATLFIVAAMVGGYLNRDPVISTGGIIAIPFYLVAIAYRRPHDITRAIRYSIILLIVFGGARYPYLFPVTFALYYIVRFHYNSRYNLHFPAFSPEST